MSAVESFFDATNNSSVFLSNLHYFYAQTDGTYRIPKTPDGQLLKRAKKEIESLMQENSKIKNELNDLLLEMEGVDNTFKYRERIAEILGDLK